VISRDRSQVQRLEGRLEPLAEARAADGNRSGLAYASLGLACLAADAGDWYRARQLHGIAQVFLGAP
jgi:hypothetical protein